ncbi:MAG: hypothetical protein RIR35_815, partial [Actinomycetota bacterium]
RVMSSKPRKTFHFAVVDSPKKNHIAMDHIAKRVSRLNNSLWFDSSASLKGTELARDEFDVSIIGGGFSGLWSAFHLIQAQPTLKIAVFEAQHFGFGASGRNGGWASSDYPVYRATLEKRHGVEKTNALFTALSTAINEIGDFSRNHAEQGHFVKAGTLMFARNSAQEIRLKSMADDLHIWQSEAELKDQINIKDLRGGLFNPECATVNPMGLLQGLFNFLKAKGVSLIENSFATAIPGGVLVNSKSIKSAVVIQATEVYGKPGRDFIPLYSQMVATEPLREEVWEEIGVRERFTFAEGSHLINYAQRTSDNRLAIGGRGATYPFGSKLQGGKEMTHAVHENIRNLARRWFPVMSNVEFTHAWGGAVAITRDWEPYVQFDKSSGFGRLGGYAGDGVTMSFLAAKIMSALVTDSNQEITGLHFVNRKIRSWEVEPLRFFAVNSLVKMSGIADREEAITKRPSVVSKIIAPLILR